MKPQEWLVKLVKAKQEIFYDGVKYITEEDIEDILTWPQVNAFTAYKYISEALKADIAKSDASYCPWCHHSRQTRCDTCGYAERHGKCDTCYIECVSCTDHDYKSCEYDCHGEDTTYYKIRDTFGQIMDYPDKYKQLQEVMKQC